VHVTPEAALTLAALDPSEGFDRGLDIAASRGLIEGGDGTIVYLPAGWEAMIAAAERAGMPAAPEDPHWVAVATVLWLCELQTEARESPPEPAA
jgi:hypothetical protein